VGVCEEYDSMGVSEKSRRETVNPSTRLPSKLRVNRASSRPFDSAQGRQFKVEWGKSKEVAGAARVPPPPGVFCKSGKQRTYA
jgi:hypothetical protein